MDKDKKFLESAGKIGYFKDPLPLISKNMNIRKFNLLFEEINSILLKEYNGKRGCYIIEAIDPDIHFTCPEGKSRIIYIGRSNNLKRRIHFHIDNLRELKKENYSEVSNLLLWPNRYHYMDHFGAKITLITPKGNKSEKNLERDLLYHFYKTYSSLPVGNSNHSYGPIAEIED